MSKEYEFGVSISADRLLAMYRGQVQNMVVRARGGLNLQLPLSNFRPYVDESGLHGFFRVVVDPRNKIESLEKIGDLK